LHELSRTRRTLRNHETALWRGFPSLLSFDENANRSHKDFLARHERVRAFRQIEDREDLALQAHDILWILDGAEVELCQ
jgi:hypothetical protein